MKKLVVVLMLMLSLSLTVAMSGIVLGAVQFVEGFNVSRAVNTYANYGTASYTYGLKYTPTVSYNLKKVELMAGEGTGPFTVQLRPDSGGWPSSTILLGTTFTMVNTVSWQGAEFSSSYPVVAGTTYWIVIKPVPGSQASICMGSATPITAVYDNPANGVGWDGYVISDFNGLPLPWMAKFYRETGGAGYDVTIWAFAENEGWMDWVPITMDGVPTGKTTPYTFTGLTGTHTFTVPSTEPMGRVFYEWSTGWTGTTLTVNSGGTYTARYRQPGKVNTQVVFGLSPNPASPGQTVTLSGTLKTVSANPVYPASVKVEYSTNGGATWNPIWTLSTNAAGQFSQSFGAPGVGTYLVRVSYAGSATYNPSSSTATLIVQTGGKVNTQVVFSFSPNPASPGQTVTLSGTLKTVSANPVYPAQVKVEYSTNGGATWIFGWNLNTNPAGQFSVSFGAPGKGSYLARVSYAGSATYNPSSSTQTLTVS